MADIDTENRGAPQEPVKKKNIFREATDAMRFGFTRAPWFMVFHTLFQVLCVWAIIPYKFAGEYGMGVHEVLLAVAMLLEYALHFGPKALKFTTKGTKYGFAMLKEYFIVLAVIAVIDVGLGIKSVATGDIVFSDVLPKILNLLMMGTAVGIVEEISFRALIFTAWYRLFGSSYKGMIWGGVVSAFLFGFIHVFSDLIGGNLNSVSSWMQAAGKTLQAGMMGFVFSVIYTRTHNLWSVAILHSVNDLLLMTSEMFTTKEIAVEYVADADKAGLATGVYVILAAIAFLFVLRTLREFKRSGAPALAPFDEGFDPIAPVIAKKPKKNKKAAA